MLDRLKLDKERIEGMAKGVLDVATLPEPVGRFFQPQKDLMVLE